MYEFSLDFLRCIRCDSKLDCEIFLQNKEIDEGLLFCTKCNFSSPIINKVPIMWDNFSSYLSNRPSLGGKLYCLANDIKLKKFIKKSLPKIRKFENLNSIEERWAKIYQKNNKIKFYTTIQNNIKNIPKSKLVLEYGCSIGLMSEFLAKSHNSVFGVDKSFSAIEIAKKTQKDNQDYFVADSLSPIFGKTKFDLILALNLLELVEPIIFLKHISNQIKIGYLIISDPYDYDRGGSSVKTPLDELTLRSTLKKSGFTITNGTKKPSHIPWNLNLNARTTLKYDVDLVIAKKS